MRPCFRSATSIWPGIDRAFLCAASAHASVRALAASLLTIRSEQKSAALRARCSNVADSGVSARLPLPASARLEQEPRRPRRGPSDDSARVVAAVRDLRARRGWGRGPLETAVDEREGGCAYPVV
jgi:hypothetical protein